MAVPIKGNLIDNYGRPIVSALVTVKIHGTSNNASLFSDENLTVAAANPIITEADGSYFAYAANGKYDLVCSKTGYTFDDTDTVTELLYDPTSYKIITNADSPYTLTDKYSVIFADASSGAITINLPALAGVTPGTRYFIVKTDNSANTVTLDPNGAEKISGQSTLVLTTQSEGGEIMARSEEWYSAPYFADYVRKGVAGTITAVHTFNPAAVGAPFIIGTNAVDQEIVGLNADKCSGMELGRVVLGNYTARTLPEASGMSDGTSNGVKRVIVLLHAASSASYYTDDDGFSFTACGVLPAVVPWKRVLYAGSQFVAISYALADVNSIATTSDGVAWTGRTGQVMSRYAIAWGNSLYCVVGDSSKCETSPDAATWTARTMATASMKFLGLSYGLSKFVAVGTTEADGTTDKFNYSANGIDWSEGSMPSSQYWSDIAFGAGKFVAISGGVLGTSSAFAISTNGTSWTAVTAPAARYWTRIKYNGKYFIALSTSTTPGVAISKDGQNWILLDTLPTASAYRGMCFGASGYPLIVGASSGSNEIIRSLDY